MLDVVELSVRTKVGVGKIIGRKIIPFISLVVLLCFTFSNTTLAENWPGWRGPRGDGTSSEKNVPVKWSTNQNIRWKTPIPGKGHASPIVWGNRIFVVTAVKEKNQRVLICLDSKNGETLWQRVVLEAPLERINRLNSYASSTPVTDGEKVYVSFLDVDKMFIAAYDFDGNKVWEVRPGVFASMHGYCSSPIIFNEKLIVNGDHDGPSYIVALNRTNGQTIWKIPRPNKTRSYCTPIIRRINERNQMVLSGTMCVASYDPDTGKQHWIIDGPTEQFVASLVYNDELLFMTCGYPDHFIQAIRPDGHGNVTDTHVAWQKDRDCSYVPSPITFGTYFIIVSDTGIATCFEAKTGKSLWRQKLGRHYSASLISADGFVYFLSDQGIMTIVRPGQKLDIVARNELGENTYASPAVSNGRIFIRADKNLYCIGPEKH